MKIGIIANLEGGGQHIVSACREMELEYEVIDLFGNNWLEDFQNKPWDGYILQLSVSIREKWNKFCIERINYYFSTVLGTIGFSAG